MLSVKPCLVRVSWSTLGVSEAFPPERPEAAVVIDESIHRSVVMHREINVGHRLHFRRCDREQPAR